MSEAKSIIIRTLIPWEEEDHPGGKFVVHDATRQAEHILRALHDAGFQIVSGKDLDEGVYFDYAEPTENA